MDSITEYQARLCINRYHRTVIENELKNIKKKIEDAIERGENCIYIYKSIGRDTQSILKNLGYQVNQDICDSHTETEIKW